MKLIMKRMCLVLLPLSALSIWQLGYFPGGYEHQIGVEYSSEWGQTLAFRQGQTVRDATESARFKVCYDGWRSGQPLSLITLHYARTGIPSDENHIWLMRHPEWSLGRGISRTIDYVANILTLGGAHNPRWAGEALIGYFFEHEESLKPAKYSGSKLDWPLRPGDWVFLHDPDRR